MRRWLHGLRSPPGILGGLLSAIGLGDEATHPPVAEGELDGGGAPWPIFPGAAPGELLGQQRKEAFVPADPNDPVGKRCCPGDVWGSWYYNVTAPTLVPFVVPANAPGRLSAGVIVVPGGGNQFLAWHKEGTRIAKWLNSVGISAFVLKYRIPSNTLATRHKAAMDAQRAVSFVRHKAAELGLGTVGMIGFSAGGHTISEVTCNRHRSYSRVDDVDKESPMPDFVLNIYGSGPALCWNKNMPPTFMALAIDDQCVSHDSALKWFQHIDAMTPPETKRHEIHIFGEGRHGYGDCSAYVEGGNFKDVCGWTINAELFIKGVVLNKGSVLDGGVAVVKHN